MKTYTIDDIEILVVLVQIQGNCHQVLLSKQDRDLAIHLISGLTSGMKLSEELIPVEFISKPA